MAMANITDLLVDIEVGLNRLERGIDCADYILGLCFVLKVELGKIMDMPQTVKVIVEYVDELEQRVRVMKHQHTIH